MFSYNEKNIHDSYPIMPVKQYRGHKYNFPSKKTFSNSFLKREWAYF